MIRIGMDPNIFTIGSIVISWHGLLTALAVLAAVIVTLLLARRAGIPDDDIYSVAIWAIPGGIVGARIVHILDHFYYYANNPRYMFGFQGLSIFGAILGVITGSLYMKIRGMPVGKIVDVVAPAMLVAQMIGRIGCLINGDAYGAPTSLPWGIIYTHPDAFLPPNWIGSIATHPTPVYEIIWDGIVLAVLWRQRGRIKPDGSLYLLYLAMYSFGRFFITFLRQDKVVIFDLQQAHILSILVFVVATVWLLRLSAQAQKVPAPMEETPAEYDEEEQLKDEGQDVDDESPTSTAQQPH